jgi:hypothetical protein
LQGDQAIERDPASQLGSDQRLADAMIAQQSRDLAHVHEVSSKEPATKRDRCAGTNAIVERARGDKERHCRVRCYPQRTALLLTVILRPRPRQRAGEDPDAEADHRSAELPRRVFVGELLVGESQLLACRVDATCLRRSAHAVCGEG